MLCGTAKKLKINLKKRHRTIFKKVKEKTLETEKGEKKNLLHIRESPKGYPQIFQQKVCMPEWTGMTYSKC